MDTVKVRELPIKSGPLSLTDLLIVEDNDGTKTTEVGQFRSLLQQSIYFNTVDDMKNSTLHEGDVVQTLGFREVNDGGGALYKIVYAPTDLDDGMLIHYLRTSDTLRAHLIINGDLNVLQCGVFGDGVSDDYTLINKAASKGFPLYFPKRTYKLTGPLELPSGTVLDMNGATLKCEVSSCICLGLDTEANNITIKNTRFIGKYGVEVYPYADNIIIENCIFDSIEDNQKMDRAISMYGVSNVTVRGCTIGKYSSPRTVTTGIYIASGTKGKDSIGNINILITGNKIIVDKYGINMTSTVEDRNTVISNNQFEGTFDTSANPSVGIQMSCNSDSISVTSCGINLFGIGIRVAGVVDLIGGFSDIIVDNCYIMYSILSDAADITLSGLQRFSGYLDTQQTRAVTTNVGYIFERMSGMLRLKTDINVAAGTDEFISSLTGYLVDSTSPLNRQRLTAESVADVVMPDTHNFPGYMNISIDVAGSGTITDLGFHSLNGQLVALYSANGAILKHNSNILCGKDTTLDQYIPVILKNVNGIWTRVG